MAMAIHPLTEPTGLIATSENNRTARNEQTTIDSGALVNFNPLLFVQKLMELKAEQDGYPGAKATVRAARDEEKTA